jgi:hypothetical protein
MLYEHDAVTDGKMDATQGTKTIYSVVSGTAITISISD